MLLVNFRSKFQLQCRSLKSRHEFEFSVKVCQLCMASVSAMPSLPAHRQRHTVLSVLDRPRCEWRWVLEGTALPSGHTAPPPATIYFGDCLNEAKKQTLINSVSGSANKGGKWVGESAVLFAQWHLSAGECAVGWFALSANCIISIWI